ncbi:hypothetical protein FJ366_02490 [Candidatus Dependentiae bacterium]|nr:hypothetical protein [Candidatus Dependentiae bacterium]
MLKRMLLVLSISISAVFSVDTQSTQQAQVSVDLAAQARVKKATEKANAIAAKIKEALSILQKEPSNQTAAATIQDAINANTNQQASTTVQPVVK